MELSKMVFPFGKSNSRAISRRVSTSSHSRACSSLTTNKQPPSPLAGRIGGKFLLAWSIAQDFSKTRAIEKHLLAVGRKST
jgi:hypothetical protein